VVMRRRDERGAGEDGIEHVGAAGQGEEGGRGGSEE
jgi:hypothetical protein